MLRMLCVVSMTAIGVLGWGEAHARGGRLGAIAFLTTPSGTLWSAGGASTDEAASNLSEWLRTSEGIEVCDFQGYYAEAHGSKEIPGQFEIPNVGGWACGFASEEQAFRRAVQECERLREGSLSKGRPCRPGDSVRLPGYTSDYRHWNKR